MATVKSVCVYCGSSGNVNESHRDAARELGTALALAGIRLVYGGGQVGLMGLVADAALAAVPLGVVPVSVAASAETSITSVVSTPSTIRPFVCVRHRGFGVTRKLWCGSSVPAGERCDRSAVE